MPDITKFYDLDSAEFAQLKAEANKLWQAERHPNVAHIWFIIFQLWLERKGYKIVSK